MSQLFLNSIKNIGYIKRRINGIFFSFFLRLSRSLLRRFGYELRPVSTGINVAAALTVKESEYYTEWSPPCPLFTPWVGHPSFEAVYEGIQPYTMVPRDHCYILLSLARYATHLSGDFAECGVYKGGTAMLLSRVLSETDKTLYLFDSFKGLPKGNTEKDNNYWHEGKFAIESAESVKNLLSDFRDIIEMREGWIPETFTGLENNYYAFVHIDVDLYQSTLDCCKYFYSRLVPGGVMLFDEYGFPATRGEKDAVDEFLADKPESPIILLTGQAMIIKLGSVGCE